MIDFKELNLFQNVAVDEILAQKIPLTYGEDGIDIFGKTKKMEDLKPLFSSSGMMQTALNTRSILKRKISTLRAIFS